MKSHFLSAGLGLLALVGCTEPNPAYNPDPLLPGECRAGNRTTQTFEEFARPDKLDVLIVIDNSGDVIDLQNAFADSTGPWLEDLKSRGIDVHVAVTTTELDGRSLAPAGTAEGCSGNSTQIVKSSQSSWTRLVACNIQQGRNGDPFQQSLQKIQTVLDDSNLVNQGFLRKEARLLVLVVSNEDDCSHGGTLTNASQARQECLDKKAGLKSLDDYAERYRGAKSTPEGIAFVAVSGPPVDGDRDEVRPVCSSRLGSAYGAERLAAMTSLLGDQGLFTSLCVEDFGPLLSMVTERLGVARSVSLCSARKMAHEPLSVSALDSNDLATPIRLGASGFVYLGATEGCENGVLSFQASALAAVKAEKIEVEYCVE